MADGSPEAMTHQPYIEEERLQELLAEYPACSAELELVAGCWFPVNWMFLQRMAATVRWSKRTCW